MADLVVDKTLTGENIMLQDSTLVFEWAQFDLNLFLLKTTK